MKGRHSVVPFVAIVALMTILSFCHARPLQRDTTSEQGKEDLMIGMSNSKMMTMMMKDEATSVNQGAAVFSHVMGVDDEEGCGGEGQNDDDEECASKKRRMMAEAHLDYIYTQHHDHP